MFEADALFVPRFDRVAAGKGVHRLGLESLSSLSDVTVFGAAVPLETFCRALSRFSSDRSADIREFVFRDILNVALGNTDNHGRNTAVLRTLNGDVRLSPLFDFAPMFLDDLGIPRICRWTGAESGGMPDWGDVADLLKDCGLEPAALRSEMAEFAGTVKRLPDILAACGVDGWLIDRLIPRIETVRLSLESVGPVTYL